MTRFVYNGYLSLTTFGVLTLGLCLYASAQQATSGSATKSNSTTTTTGTTPSTNSSTTAAPTTTTAPATTAPAPKTSTTAPVTTTPAPASTTASHAPTKSLYDRLGGEKVITSIVSDFVDRAAKDSKVNFTRHGTPKEWKPTTQNVAALKHDISQYLCMAAGGPQKYDGPALKTAHQGMQITAAEFDALSADLSASLDQLKVAKPEHDDLMKIVAGTKDQIVEQQTAPTATVSSTSSTKK